MILQIGLTKKRAAQKEWNRAGVTLIELLIVSFIILVLVSLSTPLFRTTFADLELRETVSNISKFIAFAQQEAVIDETIYKISFDFEDREYRLLRYIGERSINEHRGGSEFKSPGGRFGRVFTLPKSMDIEGDKNEILFYPDGHSDKVELRLINKDNKVMQITTTGILGHVVVTKEK